MFANTDKSNKMRHFIPVIPVYFIIITVFFVFTYFYAFDDEQSGIKLFTSPIFYFSAFMVLICHTLSMFTSPGEVGIIRKEEVRMANNKNNDPLFCNKCLVPRPERTHHCKVCHKCILKMDHHCPWVANCVGLNNQKYFYLFLIYATLGDCIAFLCLISKLITMNQQYTMDKKFTSVIEIFWDMRNILLVGLATILALSMTLAIGALFFIQTNYILYNTTTIEHKIYKSYEDNPFSSRDKISNFKLVMGERIIDWFLPTPFVSKAYNFRISHGKSTSQNSYLSLSDMQEFDENLNIEIN